MVATAAVVAMVAVRERLELAVGTGWRECPEPLPYRSLGRTSQ